jgi:hypothetical protein
VARLASKDNEQLTTDDGQFLYTLTLSAGAA